MLLPKPTVRLCVLLGLALASLVLLADFVVQSELYNAVPSMAFSMSGKTAGVLR